MIHVNGSEICMFVSGLCWGMALVMAGVNKRLGITTQHPLFMVAIGSILLAAGVIKHP